MCTVTFSPRPQGFLLAMNRDEQVTRVPALPPERVEGPTGSLLYPREPGGGTWIGVNDRGVVLALINWYSAPYPHGSHAPSRGLIIPQLLPQATAEKIVSLLSKCNLEAFNPFRLFIAASPNRSLYQADWNGRELSIRPLPWERSHWISSGFQESEAVRIRSTTAAHASDSAEAGSLPWIRSLHASHVPQKGPFSLCMHRSDARTVSYTEISVDAETARMTYLGDSPCSGGEGSRHLLHLKREVEMGLHGE